MFMIFYEENESLCLLALKFNNTSTHMRIRVLIIATKIPLQI